MQTIGTLPAVCSRVRRTCSRIASVGVALLMAACSTHKPPPAASRVERPFEQAILQASNGFLAEIRQLPAFKPSSGGHIGTVLDPMLDAGTGQQTAATVQLEQRVVEQLGARPGGVELLAFNAGSLGSAQFLLTGALTRAPADPPEGAVLINLALTELKTGKVVAQSSALARDDALDRTPLPFYAASPVLVRDRATLGYVTTSATGAGKPADRDYLGRIAADALIAEATELYHREKYQDALTRYHAAASEPGGDQLRVQSGIYLANVKLGRNADAEQAFARLVAAGIGQGELDVKFLFDPGSTVFSSDPRVSGPYPMWLRQIAVQASAAKACMNIVGHTGRTGSEAADDALSLQRASYIRQRLIGEAAVLANRTRASGRGHRDNIVGSGSDDAVDALDRRIEFRVVPCGGVAETKSPLRSRSAGSE